jgi:hypothetical protein
LIIKQIITDTRTVSITPNVVGEPVNVKIQVYNGDSLVTTASTTSGQSVGIQTITVLFIVVFFFIYHGRRRTEAIYIESTQILLFRRHKSGVQKILSCIPSSSTLGMM